MRCLAWSSDREPWEIMGSGLEAPWLGPPVRGRGGQQLNLYGVDGSVFHLVATGLFGLVKGRVGLDHHGFQA